MSALRLMVACSKASLASKKLRSELMPLVRSRCWRSKFLRATATSEARIAIPFVNAGDTHVRSGRLAFQSGFEQTSGSTHLAGGDVSGTIDIQAGLFAGYGLINGSVTNAGRLDPTPNAAGHRIGM